MIVFTKKSRIINYSMDSVYCTRYCGITFTGIKVNKYRDGIKTRGDKIGMDLCIIKPLNDVRQKFSVPTGNTSPILPPEWLHQGGVA